VFYRPIQTALVSRY